VRGALEATVLLADNKDASVTLFEKQTPCKAEPATTRTFEAYTDTFLQTR